MFLLGSCMLTQRDARGVQADSAATDQLTKHSELSIVGHTGPTGIDQTDRTDQSNRHTVSGGLDTRVNV